MKWEELLDKKIDKITTGQILTDIECPECGRNIYFNSSLILTSYPQKYQYWCSCGWVGSSHVRHLSGGAEMRGNVND